MNLKSLKLNKKSISNFNEPQKIKGGFNSNVNTGCFDVCGSSDIISVCFANCDQK